MRILVLDEAGEGGGDQAEPASGSAHDLARRLGLELTLRAPEEDALLLVRTRAGLELRETGTASARPLKVQFRPGSGSAMLRKATLAGRPETRIIDATAGLGQDSFALAEWGCRIDLIERSPVIAVLLSDAMRRAADDAETAAAAARMQLHQGDAFELLPYLAPAEVVYLDPMYPRSGREGRKAKGMRMLREILGNDLDADELLATARRAATRRVVVKRPLKAPPLAGLRPSGSLAGTTVRYDLYGPLYDGTEQEGAR